MRVYISVIYVNYNSSQLTINSIKSLEKQCKDVSFEIIIVDNASKIEEKEIINDWLSSLPSNSVKLINSQQNLGFGKANNLGAENAAGEYLFFLNPDTVVCNDVLTIFSTFLEKSDPSTVACGGSLLSAGGQPTSSYGNFPGLMQELGNIGFGLSLFLGKYYQKRIAINVPVHQSTPMLVPYVVGADIFISALAFRDVNGFDENFFMYYEETDLFYRLSKNGFFAWVVPEAKIIHLEGGTVSSLSTEKFNQTKFEMILTSKLYYYKKWFSLVTVQLLKAVFFAQILVQFTKGKMGDKILPLLKSYFSIVWGTTTTSSSAH
jgi:GT2 family glycosyltransferase